MCPLEIFSLWSAEQNRSIRFTHAHNFVTVVLQAARLRSLPLGSFKNMLFQPLPPSIGVLLSASPFQDKGVQGEWRKDNTDFFSVGDQTFFLTTTTTITSFREKCTKDNTGNQLSLKFPDSGKIVQEECTKDNTENFLFLFSNESKHQIHKCPFAIIYGPVDV